MNKRREAELVSIAFGESDIVGLSEEGHVVFSEYYAIKSGLRELSDIPDHQLSADRLRDAILHRGLKVTPALDPFGPYRQLLNRGVLGLGLAGVFFATYVVGRELHHTGTSVRVGGQPVASALKPNHGLFEVGKPSGAPVATEVSPKKATGSPRTASTASDSSLGHQPSKSFAAASESVTTAAEQNPSLNELAAEGQNVSLSNVRLPSTQFTASNAAKGNTAPSRRDADEAKLAFAGSINSGAPLGGAFAAGGSAVGLLKSATKLPGGKKPETSTVVLIQTAPDSDSGLPSAQEVNATHDVLLGG